MEDHDQLLAAIGRALGLGRPYPETHPTGGSGISLNTGLSDRG